MSETSSPDCGKGRKATTGPSFSSSSDALSTTVFVDSSGFFIVLPYLYFLVQGFGATTFTYGLLITSFALMQFICAPILGRMSDRDGSGG